tara:strand:- start:1182 stop:1391 length:210 start_codon:yes stop_codon:yes gene_type:complete
MKMKNIDWKSFIIGIILTIMGFNMVLNRETNKFWILGCLIAGLGLLFDWMWFQSLFKKGYVSNENRFIK